MRPHGVVLAVVSAALLAGAAFGSIELRDDRAEAAQHTEAAEALTVQARVQAESDRRTVILAEADLRASERREHGRTAEVAARALAQAQAAAQVAAAEAAAAEVAAAEVAAAKAAAEGAARAAAPPAPSAPAAPTAPAVPVWVTSVPTAAGDGSNGRMPASAMCLIGWGTDQIGSPQYLRCDAAASLTRLNDAFRGQFGEQIAMDLTYRSYDEQVAIRAYYGSLAARPGTSNHGLGLALDVQEWPAVYGFATPRYDWLVANGPTYGWVAPASVRADAAYPEYWHFEYRP